MGRRLYDSFPAARALFDRAEAILGYDLAQVCFEGPAEKLDATEFSQPALYVVSLAAVEALKREKPGALEACQAAAGLSLGEYSAMTFAGVMDFEHGLQVVRRRGEAMQAASDQTPSGMVSILGMSTEQVQQVCDDARGDQVLQIANFLCPSNIVVSGDNDACERVALLALEAGAMKVVPLPVAGAFHTPIMQSAVSRLSEALATVPLQSPRLPVVSNVDAEAHEDPEEIRRLLVRQVMAPVQWEQSVRHLLNRGIEMFYEVGPGRVLRGLLKRIHRKAACEGVEC